MYIEKEAGKGAGGGGFRTGYWGIARSSATVYAHAMTGSPIIDKLTQYTATYFPHLLSSDQAGKKEEKGVVSESKACDLGEQANENEPAKSSDEDNDNGSE